MRLVVTTLTGALFYVSVKSASIGPRPCTTPEGCSVEAPRCIKCPDAGENTPGYCSFLDPAWQTDLCFNLGYAQFCPNACADRHSISGGPTPGKGVRGPIDAGSTTGTSPETTPQSTPETVPESTPETNPGSGSETVPATPEQQGTPAEQPGTPGSVTIPGTPGKQGTPAEQPGTPGSVTIPGTPGQQGTPAEQPGTPDSGQIQPGGSPQPGGSISPGPRRHHRRPPGSGSTPESATPGSGQSTRPGQTVPPEEGSTLEVWPTQKNQETPQPPGQSTTPSPGVSQPVQTIPTPDQSTTPPPGVSQPVQTIPNPDQSTTPSSSSGSQSGQTLQFPTGTGPTPDPNFYNQNGNQPVETAPGSNPLPSTKNNLSETGGSIPETPHTFTTPKLAFANIGDGYDGASQDLSAFTYTDTSVDS